MVLLPAALAGAAASQVPLMFGDAVDQLQQGGPNYLRDGQPESIPGKIGQAVGRAACRRYGAGIPNLSPDAAEKYERACRPYLDGTDPTAGPALTRPFNGGRCAGTYYFVTVRFYNTSTGAVSGQTVREGFGPVSIGTSGNQAPGPGAPSPGAGFTYYPGRDLRFNGVGNISLGGVWAVRQPWEIVSVVPRGSEPNNCGDPPPDVRQPRPIADPTPPPFRFNPSPNIDVDVNVNVGVDGRITVNVGTGPIVIDPFPDGGGGGGPGGGGGERPPGDVGAPGTPQNTGAGGAAEGEAPSGKVLTGLKVNLLTVPKNRNEYAPGVFRGVCYVYMGTPAGLDHDPAGSMLRDGQFIHAEKENLTRWAVNANLGYALRVTPYYADVA